MRSTRIPGALIAMLGAAGIASASITVYFDATVGESFQEAQEAAFLAATSGITTITFDDQDPNESLTGNEYAGLGITFSQPGGFGLVALTDNPAFTPRSMPNSLFAAGGSGVDESVAMALTAPQNAVGFWVIDNELTTVAEAITFYDALDNVIYSMPSPALGSITGTTDSNFFVGLVSNTPIARVVMIEAPDDGDPGIETAGWDDVYFGVPEPGMLGPLLAGAALLRRRR